MACLVMFSYSISMLFSVAAKDLGKKYATEWIFRNFSCDFQIGKTYIIVGNNGSGKSTLLKTLVGMLSPSAGTIYYTRGKRLLPADYWFHYFSYAAPYLELIEELTLTESITFHTHFKPLTIENKQLIEELQFSKTSLHKPIKYFSSGMKQKLKLALALFADVPLLCLDEPTANLDKQNLLWYQQKVVTQQSKKIICLASNLFEEYDFLGGTLFAMKEFK